MPPLTTGDRRCLALSSLLPAICLLMSVLPGPAVADRSQADYLEELQARALDRDLAEHPQWHRMVHYRPVRIGSGVRSDADDPDFFNAAAGRHDPEAELLATLEAFFADPDTEIRGRHPQCAFIGRFHWLDEQLEFDRERLAEQPCPEFREWRETVNAGRVTLIFADAYMNNPASMFGHTLLRLDPPADRARGTPLTSYVVNHAAATAEESGLAFAISGIMGWYPGYFSIMPYYEKVREYNHLESRDLWEYELDLSGAEIERLLRHLYEVDEVSFPYYFFYKNCSYQLLAALEVARPELDLTRSFDWWALPTDTVRAVLEEDGILKDVNYRPSIRSQLDTRIPELREEEALLVTALARGEMDPDDPALQRLEGDRRTLVLEVAYDYLEYEHNQRQAGDEAPPRLHQLLVARNRSEADPPSTPSPEPGGRADEGHGTMRATLGIGQRANRDFAALEWRALYHDLLDPPAGYKPGAQIEFLSTEARLYEDGTAELERALFVDIESLVPRNDLFAPWSWTVRGGLERYRRPDGGRSLMGVLEGGAGWTWEPLADLWFHAGLQASARGSHHLDDNVRVGAGPRADLLYLGDPLRLRLRADTRRYHDDSPEARPDYDGEYHRLGAELGVSVNRNLSIRFHAQREWDYDIRADELRAAIHFYF